MQNATYPGASHSAINANTQSLDWAVWVMFAATIQPDLSVLPKRRMYRARKGFVGR
jgi:hypothetical protein